MSTQATIPAAPTAPTAAPAAAPAPSTPSTPQTSTPAAQPQTGGGGDLQSRIAERMRQAFPRGESQGDDFDAELGYDTFAEPHIEEPAQTEPESTEAGEDPPAIHDDSTEATTEGDQPAEGEQEGLDEFFSDESESISGPQQLAQDIDADPAVAEALKGNPELRNRVFANARLAAVASEFKKVFYSPEEAQVAKQGHQTFTQVRSAIGSIKGINEPGGPESTQAALNAMLQAAVVRDEDGNPRLDQNGRPITDGTVGRLFGNMFTSRLTQERAKAIQGGDEDAQAAFDIVMERLGLAPSRPEEGDANDELSSRRAELEKRERELEERARATEQQSTQAFEKRVVSGIDTHIDNTLTTLLDRIPGLNAYTRRNLDYDIRVGLREAISNDSIYQGELADLRTRPMTEKTAQLRQTAAAKAIQRALPGVVKPRFEEAGVKKFQKLKEQDSAATARVEAARSETRGAGRAAQPTAAGQSGQDLLALATQQLMRERGTDIMPPLADRLSRMAYLRAQQTKR